MVTLNLYLDTRATAEGALAPLKISINKRGRTAYIATGIKLSPHQWHGPSRQVVDHPNKIALNAIISKKYSEANLAYVRLSDAGELAGKTATEIKNILEQTLNPERQEAERVARFMPYFRRFMQNKTNKGTLQVYTQTLRRLQAFDPDIERVEFPDITVAWLTRFEVFMAQTAGKNARNIHLRNIRAVFNSAIDDEVTTHYPFRKFKIRAQATAKRSLTVEQLRTVFDYPAEEHIRRNIDMFKLIFCLIQLTYTTSRKYATAVSSSTAPKRTDFILSRLSRKRPRYSINTRVPNGSCQ